MRVRITFGADGELYVSPAHGAGGGAIGSEAVFVVRAGESWFGWKYRRLRKLGEGEHVLIAKGDTILESRNQ